MYFQYLQAKSLNSKILILAQYPHAKPLCMADIYYNVVHSKLSNFVIPYMSDISYDIMTLKYPIFYAELVNCHISELPFLYMVATLGHSSSFSELPLLGWNYVGYSSNLKGFCTPQATKFYV